ncbi:MAG: hypothetical protein B7Y89_13490 [Novosphingobium sp. 32-60-15]|nr:MAG: hypothetical protein B7Y89_13490 [Novosphingobium sp. 32-60-15]
MVVPFWTPITPLAGFLLHADPQFGGAASALLDPESTGALTVFAFQIGTDGQASTCRAWLCRDPLEEEQIEDRVGPVEPGKWLSWPMQTSTLLQSDSLARASCWLEADEIPVAWLNRFPTGAEVVRKTIELRSRRILDPDRRLLARRECEYELFRSVEQAIEMPNIAAGFADIETFISRAQTILQRRKARSGHSLELHTREIFLEELLVEGAHFQHQPESEKGKKPDFLFPSQAAYRDPSFPAERLRMLAVKTTCRDRWRQILNEADRIPQKHLLTLQEGISESQFGEMVRSGVQLVVPAGLVSKFPKTVQPHLQSLSAFIEGRRAIEA